MDGTTGVAVGVMTSSALFHLHRFVQVLAQEVEQLVTLGRSSSVVNGGFNEEPDVPSVHVVCSLLQLVALQVLGAVGDLLHLTGAQRLGAHGTNCLCLQQPGTQFTLIKP